MTDTLTYHFARSLFASHEDGTTSLELIDVYLDPKTLNFTIEVPKFIAGSPIDGATDKLKGVAFGDVAAQYEKLSELYSRWKLMAKATPMLLLDTVFVDNDDAKLCIMLSFSVRECMVTQDGKHVSIDGGPWIDVTGLTGTLIPNEPATRDKLYTMMESFNTAAGIVREIGKTDDPVQYISALEVPWATPPKTEKITPAESVDGGGDPVNPQTIDKPAEPVKTDDDEL